MRVVAQPIAVVARRQAREYWSTRTRTRTYARTHTPNSQSAVRCTRHTRIRHAWPHARTHARTGSKRRFTPYSFGMQYLKSVGTRRGVTVGRQRRGASPAPAGGGGHEAQRKKTSAAGRERRKPDSRTIDTENGRPRSGKTAGASQRRRSGSSTGRARGTGYGTTRTARCCGPRRTRTLTATPAGWTRRSPPA
jgi:hypothetical protein